MITVTVSLKIRLDPDKWAEYQGCARDAVREDVAEHVLYNIQGSTFLEEADATVELNQRSKR